MDTALEVASERSPGDSPCPGQENHLEMLIQCFLSSRFFLVYSNCSIALLH